MSNIIAAYRQYYFVPFRNWLRNLSTPTPNLDNSEVDDVEETEVALEEIGVCDREENYEPAIKQYLLDVFYADLRVAQAMVENYEIFLFNENVNWAGTVITVTGSFKQGGALEFNFSDGRMEQIFTFSLGNNEIKSSRVNVHIENPYELGAVSPIRDLSFKNYNGFLCPIYERYLPKALKIIQAEVQPADSSTSPERPPFPIEGVTPPVESPPPPPEEEPNPWANHVVSFPEYTGRTEKNYRDSIKTYAGETFYTNSKVQYALRKNTPIGHVFSKIHGQLTISANFKFENDYPNEIVSREKLQIHIYDKSTDQSCTIYIAQDGRITGSDLRKLPEEIKQEFIYAIEQVLPQILAAVPNPPSEPTLCNDLSHFGYSQALIDQCNQECSDAPDPNQCKLEFQKDQREQ